MNKDIYILIIITCVLMCMIIAIYNNQISLPDTTANIDIDMDENDIPSIHINRQLYEKMVDIVTDYSMKSKIYDEKLILIYLSTFHLFDMNYGIKTIKKLDDSLSAYPYYPNNTHFPAGNMHHNLQKAIITNITLKIINSDLYLSHDATKDRRMIDIYLNNLFTTINIV